MADEKAALTAKVVAAYLRNNHVAVSDVAELIRGTYAALVGVTVPIVGPTEQPQPFVSIKKSVTPDAIICLECGKSQNTALNGRCLPTIRWWRRIMPPGGHSWRSTADWAANRLSRPPMTPSRQRRQANRPINTRRLVGQSRQRDIRS